MWKWIAGSALFVMLLLAGTCYYGYRKFAEEGSASVVTIAATPDRVYASLADPDSLSSWVDVGSTVASPTHGLLQVGDSFRVVRPPRKKGLAGESITWRVMEAVPGRALTLQIINDSLQDVAIISRYDTLAVVGDSTRVSTIYGVEIVDSTRLSARTGGKGESAVLGFAEKLIVAAMRLATEQDLRRLKARIERH